MLQPQLTLHPIAVSLPNNIQNHPHTIVNGELPDVFPTPRFLRPFLKFIDAFVLIQNGVDSGRRNTGPCLHLDYSHLRVMTPKIAIYPRCRFQVIHLKESRLIEPARRKDIQATLLLESCYRPMQLQGC